jgi:hypothetical protein
MPGLLRISTKGVDSLIRATTEESERQSCHRIEFVHTISGFVERTYIGKNAMSLRAEGGENASLRPFHTEVPSRCTP